jgi:DUF4097 and DUF4098 domain-containing protein YvlB
MHVLAKGLFLPYLVVLLPLGACNMYSATAERTLNAPLPASASLVVRTENGAVDVRVEERADVAIVAEIRTRGATAFEAEERLEEVDLLVEEREGALHVEATFPEGEVSGDSCSFRIRAPSLAAVTVATSNGSIELHGTGGNAVLGTSNGAVVVRKHGGNVRVGTSNGSVEIEGVRGETQVETSNGSIELVMDGPEFHAFHLTSSNGSVEVALGGDPQGRVEVSTTNGVISSRGFDSSGDDDRRAIVFTDAGPTSTISTSNGNISIRRR